MTLANIVLTLAGAWLFTEFAGYWLHLLLHSEKIEFLSRNHMIHHLVVYPPNKPMRPADRYLRSTRGRAAVLGIGLEWIVPVAAILGASLGALALAGVPSAYRTLFAAASLAWGWVMFGYVHDGMHVRGFWLSRAPGLRRWFLNARRLHDIHHMDLADDGRQTANFGICFYFFDRLFGSYQGEFRRFNRAGLEAALRRYAYVLPRFDKMAS